MDWQEITVLCIVSATALAFVAGRLRRRKRQSHCLANCGCLPDSSPPIGSSVYHSRKGERPTLTIKTE